MPAACGQLSHREEMLLARRIGFLSTAMLVLFAGTWCSWFYPFDDQVDRTGTPLGADFPAFYLAGQMMLSGDSPVLYDPAVAHERLHGMFPTMRPGAALPFRYPPFVALAMAPLAALPYPAAFALFTGGSIGLLVLSLYWLARDLQCLRLDWGRPVWLVALGVPVVLETIAGGQASMWAVAIAAISVALLRRGKMPAAGAVLALALYKPNVLGIFAVACWLRYPKVWLGALPTALLLGGLSVASVGWQGIDSYLEVTTSLATHSTWEIPPPVWKFHSLEPHLDWFLPGVGRPLLVLSGLLASLAIVWSWRRADIRCPGDEPAGSFNLALGLLLVVQTISNPYLPIYDLSLLVVAVPLVAEGLCQNAGQARRGRETRHGAQALPSGLLLAQVCLGWLFFGPHLSQATMLAGGPSLFLPVLLLILAWLAWYQRAAVTERGCGFSR